MEIEIDRVSTEVKRRWFSHHCPDTARLNHGAYGDAPAPVFEASNRYRERWRAQPDRVFRYETEADITRAREAIAALVNCPTEEITLIDNSTTAGEIVMQHVMKETVRKHFAGEAPAHSQLYVFGDSWLYTGMQATSRASLALVGIKELVADLPLPLPADKATADDLIVDLYEQALSSVPRGSIRLAILHHISAMPAVLFPIKRLVELCHKHAVQDVFIDGAHGIGQVTVDVTDIGADYYCSTAHKWLFAPASAAFLHCKKSPGKEEPHHIVASRNYGMGLPKEASWVGTRDYSPLQCVYDSLRFIRDELDPFLRSEGALADQEWDKKDFQFLYSAWNHHKFLHLVKILTDGWETSMASSGEMVGSLGMVELPQLPAPLTSMDDANAFRDFLREQFNVEVKVDVKASEQSPSGFAAFVRLAVMVYTTSGDVKRLRDAILAIKNGDAIFRRQ